MLLNRRIQRWRWHTLTLICHWGASDSISGWSKALCVTVFTICLVVMLLNRIRFQLLLTNIAPETKIVLFEVINRYISQILTLNMSCESFYQKLWPLQRHTRTSYIWSTWRLNCRSDWLLLLLFLAGHWRCGADVEEEAVGSQIVAGLIGSSWILSLRLRCYSKSLLYH